MKYQPKSNKKSPLYIGLLQKKTNRGLIEDMELPGVSKKQHVKFPGVFGLGIYKGCNAILHNFQRWSFDLLGISRGKVNKPKMSGGVSNKYVLNPPRPPVWFFLEQPIVFEVLKVLLIIICKMELLDLLFLVVLCQILHQQVSFFTNFQRFSS